MPVRPGDIRLNTVFIDAMQNAKALRYDGRYEKLEPALVEAL